MDQPQAPQNRSLRDALTTTPLLTGSILGAMQDMLLPRRRRTGPASRMVGAAARMATGDAAGSEADVAFEHWGNKRQARWPGAQYRFNTKPARVELWTTFWDDVDIGNAAFMDQPIPEMVFESLDQDFHSVYSETDASRLWNDAFGSDCQRRVFAQPRFGFVGDGIGLRPERNFPAFRPDFLWDCERAGPGAMVSPGRSAFLVHEHKNPIGFPFHMTWGEQGRLVDGILRTRPDTDPDYVADRKRARRHEFARTMWAAMQTDLPQYWADITDRAARDELSEAQSIRMLYPIIQTHAYMLRLWCKYGVLSTTEYTWFFKLEPDNTLLVSSAFHATDTGPHSVKLAYFSVLVKALEGGRLDVDDDVLRELGNNAGLNVVGSAWSAVYARLVAVRPARGGEDPFPAAGAFPPRRASRSGGAQDADDDSRDQTGARASSPGGAGHSVGPRAKAQAEALLRGELPFPNEGFTYHGGLVDVTEKYRETRLGSALRVKTRGVDTVVKVMRQVWKDGDDPGPGSEDYGTEFDPQLKITDAFAREMAAYEALRSIWGAHVPWYLYGGTHLFGDTIIATTYEGTRLDRLAPKDAYSEATRAKARAALDAVHALGVAHGRVKLRKFVMDEAGAVRLVNFAASKLNAAPADLDADVAAFERAFARPAHSDFDSESDL